MGQDSKPKPPPATTVLEAVKDLPEPPPGQQVYSNGPFSAGPPPGKVTLHPLPAKGGKKEQK